jgi:CBS domain-containing protein
MRPVDVVIPPDTSISSLVNDWLLRYEERSYPVVDAGGRLLGVVSVSDIRKAPRDAWDSTPVSRVMTPVDAVVTTSPREDLGRAFDELLRHDTSEIPVVDGDRLVGMLRRFDIARWIELHVAAPARAHAR